VKYWSVIEKAENNYSAYLLDLPGCIATGKTVEEVTENLKGAVQMHLEGLKKDGQPIPEPMVVCEAIEM